MIQKENQDHHEIVKALVVFISSNPENIVRCQKAWSWNGSQDHGVSGRTKGSPSSAKTSQIIEHHNVGVTITPDSYALIRRK